MPSRTSSATLVASQGDAHTHGCTGFMLRFARDAFKAFDVRVAAKIFQRRR